MEQSKANDAAGGRIITRPGVADGLIAHGWLAVQAFDRHGRLKWVDEGPNLIVTTGRNALLDECLGTGSISAWYAGLINNAGFSAIAAGDTMASHAGWAESTAYTESARQTLSFSSASAGVKTTSAAVAFSINATVTINGIFIASNSTKGGTTGTLFAAKSFSAARSLFNGDTLQATYSATLTAS